MKIGNTEKALLLGILGIAIAVLAVMYVAKPSYEKAQSIEADNVDLRARLSELEAKQADREFYIAETERFNQEYDVVLDAFPADLNQEITIMFLEGIKDTNEFDFETVAMGQKEQFYTLGVGGSDASLEDVPVEDEFATEEVAATGSSLQCYRAVFPMTYKGSYESLKNVVNYIDTYSDRMTINSIDIAYDEGEDTYSGNITMYCYAVEGEDRAERTVELNEIQTGVDNVFDTGYVVGSAEVEGMTAYDDNEGASLETSYDFYAMLSPATSDVSAKVVGQNGSGKDASVISDTSEGVSVLTYDFYESAGKTYCKYTLDNKQSYEAEVTSAEDVKLLIKSSAKKGDDDKVGVRVTINNTSSLPVYVKVSGDDSVSPRVTIAGTSGSVKVYK